MPKRKSGILTDKIRAHLEICRFDHWIKNIFVVPGVLIAIAVSKQQIDIVLIERFLIGLLATGFVASSNYVINEVLDAPFDIKHPKKCKRPVPRGRVNVALAYIQWIALLIVGLALATYLSEIFTLVCVMLWVMGCIYNIPPLRTKDLPYLDVLSESVNNPLRMLAGWYIVDPGILPSTSLLMSYWMLGGYLMALKRYAEYRDIDSKAVASYYRRSFRYYNENRLLVSTMFYAAASMLFLGAFIMRYRIELILSFPFIAWVMALYMNLAFDKESAVQAPEKLYREPYLVLSVLVCSTIMIGLFFISIPGIGEFFTPTLPTGN